MLLPVLSPGGTTQLAVQSTVPTAPGVGAAQWVTQAASAFIMQHPAAVAFAQQALPENRFLTKALAAKHAEFFPLDELEVDHVVLAEERKEFAHELPAGTPPSTLAELNEHLPLDHAIAEAPRMPGELGPLVKVPLPAARNLAHLVSLGVGLIPALALGATISHNTGDAITTVCGAGVAAGLGTLSYSFIPPFSFGEPAAPVRRLLCGAAIGGCVGMLISGLTFALQFENPLGGVGECGAVGLIGGAAAGFGSWFSARLASLFNRPVAAFRKWQARLQLYEVTAWAGDPQQQRAFFAAHPAAYADFLVEGVSTLFRAKQGDAVSRADLLRQKFRALQQQFERTEWEIETSAALSADDRALRLLQLRLYFWDVMERVGEQLDAEAERVAAIDGFVATVLDIAASIRQTLAVQGVDENIAAFEALAAGVVDFTHRAEGARGVEGISLEAHWERLRDMGDQMVALHQGIEEIELLLSDGVEE